MSGEERGQPPGELTSPPWWCRESKAACRKAVEDSIKIHVLEAMEPLAEVKTMVSGLVAQLEEAHAIALRVHELEVWRAKLNGKAEESVKKSAGPNNIEEMRNAINAAVAESHGTIIAELKTRSKDSFSIQRPVAYAVLAAITFVAILAALAGERVIPHVLEMMAGK